MCKNHIVKQLIPAVAATALLLGLGVAAQPASAAYISNGDFETLDNVNPPFAAWSDTVGVMDNTTDPIGGSHSLGIKAATGGQSQQSTNDPNNDLTRWSIDFDLALSDAGGNEDRAFQFYLQQFSGSRINLRVTDVDDDGDGDLSAYNNVPSGGSSGWHPLISDAVTFSTADDSLSVNHVRVVGDFASATPSFNVYVTDANGVTRSVLNNVEFQDSSPVLGTTLDQVVYQGGYLDGGGFFVVDNVAVNAVPEPATLALLSAGGLLMLSRKRLGHL